MLLRDVDDGPLEDADHTRRALLVQAAAEAQSFAKVLLKCPPLRKVRMCLWHAARHADQPRSERLIRLQGQIGAGRSWNISSRSR
jgi:hypothetical protein